MDNVGDADSSKWLYDVDLKRSAKDREFASGIVKVYLYESLHRGLTKHDLNECFQLIEVLPKETSLDPYILFRFIMILIACNPTEAISKNVMIHLESLISNLDVCRPDVFVEFLSYFIKHNRIDDARELLSQRHRHMSIKIHRIIPYTETNFQCYQFLLNYLKWSESVSDKRDVKLNFDVSIQGWIVNVGRYLTSTKSNHEYFLMCLIRMLLFYGYNKKAYLFSSQFQRNNPDNLSGQLLHYHLLQRLSPGSMKSDCDTRDKEVSMDCDINEEDREQNRCEDMSKLNNFHIEDEAINLDMYPIEQDRKKVIANFRRLDPCIEELANLENDNENPIDALRNLLDTLEFISEVSNTARWVRLLEVVEYIFDSEDEILIREARLLWCTRYRRYWRPINFVALAGLDITDEQKETLVNAINTLSSTLDCSDLYLKKRRVQTD